MGGSAGLCSLAQGMQQHSKHVHWPAKQSRRVQWIMIGHFVQCQRSVTSRVEALSGRMLWLRCCIHTSFEAYLWPAAVPRTTTWAFL
jgi:hypothetical protein